MNWILLVLSLSTASATARMRAWRALKTEGAAVLRDGAYLLPASQQADIALQAIAKDVRDHDGIAYVLPTSGDIELFAALFDRTEEWQTLLKEITSLQTQLLTQFNVDVLKQTRKLRKNFSQLVAIDFFPTEAQNQVASVLQDLEQAVAKASSPDEPQALSNTIAPLLRSDFNQKIWATRARPWVDRLASAWLICRFIDTNASFLWLASLNDCPADAIGFDFDGAYFSHVGHKVTFETLLASFSLETPALQRLAQLVHFLDVGGVQPPEAEGIEKVLAGLRESIQDDDQLLTTACQLFDGLLISFNKV
ncbi:chromate resistance protein ChrB domain-containing protein [Agitococcus lubricus]|uniref:Chromate resistance exported protein n=1 Tax=Agitococcus lubricus TaxID=1077255 RepID=A0A2T5J013_9GAMM|nr:chromate resistance protein ChrB domain-containing protein [Agitococcus lubricus]PTQ89633.1 hypothetical protein C8N29_106165 [Agitococcus lubricus]